VIVTALHRTRAAGVILAAQTILHAVVIVVARTADEIALEAHRAAVTATRADGDEREHEHDRPARPPRPVRGNVRSHGSEDNQSSIAAALRASAHRGCTIVATILSSRT
jgi:hypothetical protein